VQDGLAKKLVCLATTTKTHENCGVVFHKKFFTEEEIMMNGPQQCVDGTKMSGCYDEEQSACFVPFSVYPLESCTWEIFVLQVLFLIPVICLLMSYLLMCYRCIKESCRAVPFSEAEMTPTAIEMTTRV
jgi:hypothetical protein